MRKSLYVGLQISLDKASSSCDAMPPPPHMSHREKDLRIEEICMEDGTVMIPGFSTKWKVGRGED
jgi:hypothetical protein